MLNFPNVPVLPDDMLLRFAHNTREIVNNLPRPTAARMLYHYTPGLGFERIIETEKLWATHVSFMNDAEEYIDATNTLKSEGQAELKNTSPGTPVHYLLTALMDNLSDIGVEAVYPWFITCFSLGRNDLSQWRSYSGKESKFSLGFDIHHLYKIADSLCALRDDQGFLYRAYLAPVTYHSGRKRLIARDVLAFMLRQFPVDQAALQRVDIDLFAREWMVQYFAFVSVVAPTTKNKAFRQEREWRLLVKPTRYDLIKFRNRGSILTPYLEIDLRLAKSAPDETGRIFEQPLREAWIGPSPYMRENQQSALALLTKKKFWWVNLHMSDIPYRDF